MAEGSLPRTTSGLPHASSGPAPRASSPTDTSSSGSPRRYGATLPAPSERSASPVQGSGTSAYSYSSAPSQQSHRAHTPVSPQYTFGGHTPLSPQSFASGHTATGIMPNYLAVPEGDELTPVLETGAELDLASYPAEPQESATPMDQEPQQGEAGLGDSGMGMTSSSVPEEAATPAAASSRLPPFAAGLPERADSPDSMATRTPTTHRSAHSSWQPHGSPTASSAAINIAHKQRVSQAPPLPEKPYHAPPSAVNRPLTPTAATSLLAAAASSLQTPTMSATRLSIFTTASSVRRKSRTGAKSPFGDDIKDLPPVPPLPPGVVYTPSAGPSAAAELKAAIDAGEAPPHYAFLDQDPTQAERDSPPSNGDGVMTFSGGDRRVSSTSALVQGSSPHSSNSQRKHLSFQSQSQSQSQHSDAFGYGAYAGTSSSMAEAGDSNTNGSSSSNNGRTDRAAGRLSAQSFRDQWATFAGGPAPAWGKRDSNRVSIKSYRSGRSVKSQRKLKRRSNATTAAGHGEDDEWVDDDEADLMALVRRAAVLERLLRHGKRASNINANPRMVQRYSHWSVASTSLSMAHTSRSRSGSPEKLSNTPPRRSDSSATTHRSKRSATSSLRHRLQRRLGIRGGARDFAEVGSDDGMDSTAPDMSVEGIDDDSSTSIRTPQTPIRHAFSSSTSRHEQATPPPGAGAGIIVFPELAALPPLESPRHDGEVCAQACLPPSVAVPYTPLPPPPEAVHASRSSKSKHSRTFSGGSEGGTKGSIPQRSLHSLKNLRHAFDEKAGGGFSDNRASVHSGTVLFGDVPTCDQRFGGRRARKLRILTAIACICGIAIIIGLLAGLLSRRSRSE